MGMKGNIFKLISTPIVQNDSKRIRCFKFLLYNSVSALYHSLRLEAHSAYDTGEMAEFGLMHLT